MTEIDKLYKMLEQIYDDRESRRTIVPCILGAPGIGKTQTIERLAKARHAKVVHLIASQILPSEVSGITMPVNDTKSMEIYDNLKISSLGDGDILFLDELLKGQQQVLNAMLTLVEDRRMMSERKLKDVMIVAAANPLGSPNQLPLEIRQRFMFYTLRWNPDDWTDYMRREHGVEPNRQIVHRISRTMADPNSSGWNALTPRTATKLLLMMKRGMDIEDMVDNMFGDRTVYLDLKRSFDGSAPKLDQTVDAIRRMVNIDHVVDSGEIGKIDKAYCDHDITAEEFIKMLSELPEWKDLSERLGNMEFEGERMDL